MTEAIYLEVTEKTEAAKKAGRRVSVSGMLKFLGVSRSGYLAWLHHVPSDTEKRRKAVKAKIQDIYDDSKQNYGAPKITVELRKTGEVISERTVGTYMRQMGIRAQWSKPWTITTKDSDFSTELQNILDEQFNPDRPNAVWCSDITYIWTIDGFVYLTSVMDLFSRKIIAWTLSETLEVSCVIDTINKAKARRNIDQPLIIHSDRGSQYVAKAMNSFRIVESFQIFKNQLVCLLIITDFKAIEPFTFDNRMKGFNACIIPRKSFLRITALHIFGCFFIFLCNILTATIRMDN